MSARQALCQVLCHQFVIKCQEAYSESDRHTPMSVTCQLNFILFYVIAHIGPVQRFVENSRTSFLSRIVFLIERTSIQFALLPAVVSFWGMNNLKQQERQFFLLIN
jgi:hypothetical protein